MTRPALSVAAFAAVLALAGCGGGSSSSTSPAPASTGGGQGSSGGQAKVVMKNIQFNPRTITVQKGTTVVWTNEDSVNHDVTKTSGPGPSFSSGSGSIGSGGSFKFTFSTPGTIQYRCTVHPGMTGTIVVK